MIILGVECSAQSAGAAVVKDSKLLSECFVNCGLTHSETLLPMIDSALSMAGVDICDVDLIAVSDGPGSFTGLRIGVGTVKGLAIGADIKVLGVSPLEALCYNVPNADGIIAAIMDARREQVYCALYKWEDGVLKEIKSADAMPLSDLLEEACEGATFVGDGAAVFKDKIKEKMGDKAKFPTDNLIYQRASSIAMAAVGKEGINEKELQPVYLRKPQAERERIEKEKNLK